MVIPEHNKNMQYLYTKLLTQKDEILLLPTPNWYPHLGLSVTVLHSLLYNSGTTGERTHELKEHRIILELYCEFNYFCRHDVFGFQNNCIYIIMYSLIEMVVKLNLEYKERNKNTFSW